MLETSKDLLNVLIGASVLLVAVLFSWLLYQMARAVKGMNDVIDKVKNIADSVQEGIDTVKNKSSHAAAYVGLFIKGGQEILKQLQKRKVRKANRPKNQGNKQK